MYRPAPAHPPLRYCAALCIIFAALLIIFSTIIVIILLVVKPTKPVLDISHANQSTIYFDSPDQFDADFAFLATFSNPNKKLNLQFKQAVIELLFEDDVIGTQSVQLFSLRHEETRAVVIKFESIFDHLPPNLAMELKKQVQINKSVLYLVRGTFKFRASFGAVHFTGTYWVHGWCYLEMTGPPSGSLTTPTCIMINKKVN